MAPERRSRPQGSDHYDDRQYAPHPRRRRRSSGQAMGFAMMYVIVVIGISALLACFGWIAANDVLALNKTYVQETVTVTQDMIREDGTANMGEVASLLKEKGLIQYKGLFRLFSSLTHGKNKVIAGSFNLNTDMDYRALISGMSWSSSSKAKVKVTIPEGYTCAQIFALLAENGVCTEEKLEETAASYAFDYTFLKDLPYGAANRLEGYLFPDTYEFYVDDSPQRVLSKFLDNFGWKFSKELQNDIAALNEMLRAKMEENGFTEEEIAAKQLDLNDIVIVASLIERETGGTSESSSIASVIYNRLCSKIYPLLEIDASVRYGLDKWDEDLTQADLNLDTPYNTRKNPGLPAGPISNPGLDSIRAALYPRDTSYYFYALNPESGLHHFSETYYEHQNYVEALNGNES